MAQGHFYKDSMCQIVFGNTSLSLPHMQQPRFGKKKKKKATLHSPSIMLKNWVVQGEYDE
jgi:hypothetical protein